MILAVVEYQDKIKEVLSANSLLPTKGAFSLLCSLMTARWNEFIFLA